MESKKWYTSKTIIVNLLAAIAIVVQMVTGENFMDAETQAAILTLVNLVLRIFTKQPLV